MNDEQERDRETMTVFENVPNPEVPAKATRRQFSAAYKLRILAEADACSVEGELGRLLRREGLYSSHLSNWRRARREGTLLALSPKKRGRKSAPVNPLARQVTTLQREKQMLEDELRKARLIIEVQKKVARLMDEVTDGEKSP